MDNISIIGSSRLPCLDPSADKASVFTELTSSARTSLDTRLRAVFNMPDDEEFIASCKCWLLKNVLLQGLLYLTQSHLYFYSYLPPRRTGEVVKSGSLIKENGIRGGTRYWFVLRSDFLSFHEDSNMLYFPSGIIDLSRIEHIKMKPSTDPNTPSLTIQLFVGSKTYSLRADSPENAESWLSALINTTFRSQNDGGSVKIAIPLVNILELEPVGLFEFANSFRIKVVDESGSYAIDDYIFAVFGKEESLFSTITEMVSKSNPVQEGNPIDPDAEFPIQSDQETPPGSPPLASSGKVSGRRSTAYSYATARTIGPLMNAGGSFVKAGVRMAGKIIPISRLSSVDSGSSKRRGTDYSLNPVPEDVKLTTDTGRHSLVGLVKDGSRIANYLIPNPLTYIGKVSEMWTAPAKHFDSSELQRSDDLVDTADLEASAQRFRDYFNLTDKEQLIASYFAHLHRLLPMYGKVYLSTNYFCYRSLLPGTNTKMVLPLKDIETIDRERGFRFGYSGLVIVIHGFEEVFFEFGSQANRDDCEVQTLRAIDELRGSGRSIRRDSLASALSAEVGGIRAPMSPSRLVELKGYSMDSDSNLSQERIGLQEPVPVIFKDEGQVKATYKPSTSWHVVCLTIGSRGDVQPYIALALRLMEDNHRVTIATHGEFKDWVESYGIGFREIAGDPSKIMALCIENGMFSYNFLKEASSKFRNWIDELFQTSWEACQGADVLIESPSTMSGIHIAEALKIPYFRAFTMPWTRTRAYPHAFMVPDQKMGGSYNSLTYAMFDSVFWKAISGQVNRWRKKTLGIPHTSYRRLQQNKTPFLYCVSPSVFVPPVDFPDWVKVTGYWFLNEAGKYQPDSKVVSFIEKARKENKKIVYIGFGSIIVDNAKKLTETIVKAVVRADTYCILVKGWSTRGSKKEGAANDDESVVFPDQVLAIDSIPHDWLFPRIDAAVHHGGSGTTGASLRAGIPTLIKPFFGDQYFYATRVEDLGVGKFLHKITVDGLSKALTRCLRDDRIINRARSLGERIRKENGVETAVSDIYGLYSLAAKVSLDRSKTYSQSKGKVTAAAETARVDDASESSDDSWYLLHKQI
ncbi:glycosyltransferase family 1 protein [Tortispora caseinolytica NRRL Y-17796]|uniref:Sterol 3-beta-glucosyltransferase n=1 Tax=Tortispora caseinolytica NRRL Y-17796 TaxID=767744 RepID=A0A1E4THY9_9ASCO|nr:glycosyltransferase family 1 protein [Tortispora caseinolytica NRRL Y-17796]